MVTVALLGCLMIALAAPSGGAQGVELFLGPLNPENVDWELIGLGGSPLATQQAEKHAHFRFEPSIMQVYGFTGCNHFSATYRMDGDKLSFTDIRSTLMACRDTTGLESAFIKVLSATTRYQMIALRLDLYQRDKLLASFHKSATAPAAHGGCSDRNAWNASLDLSPGDAPQPVLHVVGKCTFPTGGWAVELKPHFPQGLNSEIYLLDIVVHAPPPGVSVTQAVTTMTVRYSLATRHKYKMVLLFPDKLWVPVSITH